VTPDVVVDIGNTRMKWGLVRDGKIADSVSLAGDIPEDWSLQVPKWNLSTDTAWAVASVHPQRTKQFTRWAEAENGRVVQITHAHVPLSLDLDEPGKVGIDRLLGAVGARALAPAGSHAVTVDIGTAVTVNLVDATGVFRGGAIFPGPRLMAAALARDTAALPNVKPTEVPFALPPGHNTEDAIRAGIAAAIQGGVAVLVERLAARYHHPHLFVTGGARGCLANYRFRDVAEYHEVPHLNLEGIRITAESCRE
jgi:type III pantothenate kinase